MTCREAIKRALRMLGVLGKGEEPSADDANDGLSALVTLYADLIGNGTLGALTPVIADADYEAGENERVVKGAHTITLPTTVTDDCSSEARPPRNRAVVVIATTTPEHHIYVAEQAVWVQTDTLELDDFAPLSSEGLCARLAASLSVEQGVPLPPLIAAAASQFTLNLSLAAGEARDEPAYY